MRRGTVVCTVRDWSGFSNIYSARISCLPDLMMPDDDLCSLFIPDEIQHHPMIQDRKDTDDLADAPCPSLRAYKLTNGEYMLHGTLRPQLAW